MFQLQQHLPLVAFSRVIPSQAWWLTHSLKTELGYALSGEGWVISGKNGAVVVQMLQSEQVGCLSFSLEACSRLPNIKEILHIISKKANKKKR